jgi:surfactin synthase thioesterase subunit
MTTPIRLYCFSHVGGSALVYRAWQRLLPPAIAVCPVELPGHTARMKEAPLSDCGRLVEMLAGEIAADIARQPGPTHAYATYGHCTGAPLSFRVATRLAAMTGRPPVRSFFAASHPPDMPVASLGGLSDSDLLCLIERMGGTPRGLMKDVRMQQLMLPVLRADALINDQCYVDTGDRADWPFTVFAARDDHDLKADDIHQWSRFTRSDCRQVLLAGSHFHALHAPQEALEHVRADLATDAANARAATPFSSTLSET